jgi:restriction endonuclease S subunit
MKLAQTLAEGDFDIATIQDTIEASGIEDEISAKAQGLEYVARGAEAHNLAIDAEIARLQALKAHRMKVAAGLRGYLLENMQRAGIERIDCPMFQISIKKNPPAVDIYDQLSLPGEYMVTPKPKPPVAAPDKDAIKAAIKAGKEVTGARLVQGVRLAIA